MKNRSRATEFWSVNLRISKWKNQLKSYHFSEINLFCVCKYLAEKWNWKIAVAKRNLKSIFRNLIENLFAVFENGSLRLQTFGWLAKLENFDRKLKLANWNCIKWRIFWQRITHAKRHCQILSCRNIYFHEECFIFPKVLSSLSLATDA